MARGYTTGLVTGIGVSLTAALLAPLWRPVLTRWGRPAAKAAIKGGIAAYELGRERVAEVGESVEDLVAEAQVELAMERLSDAQGESASETKAA